MLRLCTLHKPTNAKYLLSCLNHGSNQGSNPIPSANLAVRSGCLTPLALSVSSVHTLCKQRIMGSALFDLVSYVPSKQGHVQTGHWKTVSLFSTSTKCMQENHTTDQLLEEVKAKEYISLYLHSKLRFLRFFCSLAKVSTIAFAVGTPITLTAFLMDFVSQENAIGIVAPLGMYSSVLIAQNYIILSNIICRIMISEDERHVKLSCLSIFGKRRDIYVKVSDILPVPGSLYDRKLHRIKLKGSSKLLFLMTDQGGDDTDFEALDMLFSENIKKAEP